MLQNQILFYVFMSKSSSTAHKTGTYLLKTEQVLSWYIQVTTPLPSNVTANFKVSILH